MKKYFVLVFTALLFAANASLAQTLIRFNESVLPYNGGLLIPNFGSKTLKSAQEEAKGYVLYYKDEELKPFIPADGYLNHPTAMAVYNNKLFICNSTNIVVYNLQKKTKPQIIKFTTKDKAINDLFLKDDTLYVSATDTDTIYKINLKTKKLKPQKWITVPSPNGIAIYENTMYIASIPKDYKNINSENVVYVIKDINSPVVEKLNNAPALYDGIAVSADGKIVYVSDWHSSSVIAIDTETKLEKPVFIQNGMTPADIALEGTKLYIPDLVNHRVILFDIQSGKTNIIQ